MGGVVSVHGSGLSASVQPRICASASHLTTESSLSRTSSTPATSAARSTGIRLYEISINATGITGNGSPLFNAALIVTTTAFIPDDGRELLL